MFTSFHILVQLGFNDRFKINDFMVIILGGNAVSWKIEWKR